MQLSKIFSKSPQTIQDKLTLLEKFGYVKIKQDYTDKRISRYYINKIYLADKILKFVISESKIEKWEKEFGKTFLSRISEIRKRKVKQYNFVKVASIFSEQKILYKKLIYGIIEKFEENKINIKNISSVRSIKDFFCVLVFTFMGLMEFAVLVKEAKNKVTNKAIKKSQIGFLVRNNKISPYLKILTNDNEFYKIPFNFGQKSMFKFVFENNKIYVHIKPVEIYFEPYILNHYLELLKPQNEVLTKAIKS